MSVKRILEDTKDFWQPGMYASGDFATKDLGDSCSPIDPKAKRFCLLGAVAKTMGFKCGDSMYMKEAAEVLKVLNLAATQFVDNHNKNETGERWRYPDRGPAFISNRYGYQAAVKVLDIAIGIAT